MRPIAKYLLPAVVASLTLAACGSSTKSQGSSSQAGAAARAPAKSAATGASVKSVSNSALGATVLTNAQGMTLYSLSGEHAGKFICTTPACTQVWHPLTASGTNTPSGSVASLATVKRPDGSEQVSYNGMPLYTFAEDQKPGQAKGQGIKDVGTWTAATIAAAKPAAKTAPAPESASAKEAAPESESSSGSSGSGGAYGY
jgi:predicted lipoprotein with Yx(FWY)xxD motif